MNDQFIKKHVLIISSKPQILAEIKMAVMEHFEISIAATSEAAIAILKMYDVSAVIINICEDREKAFSVFAIVSESVKDDIPFILLAERGNDEDENTAFMMNAADYSVRRPGTVNALISRIKICINASENKKRLSGDKGALEGISSKKTILIADDIEINRDIIAVMVSSISDFNLVFASNGKEAVDKFLENPCRISLIIMDIQMPVMDGFNAVKTIRGLNCKNAKKVTIIAATASVKEEDIKLCYEAGMDGYLEKPMDFNKLLAVTTKHCV